MMAKDFAVLCGCFALLLGGAAHAQVLEKQVNKDVLAEFLHTLPTAKTNPLFDSAPQTSANSDASSQRSDAVVYAMSLVGTLYKRGGTDAATGLDCSGFVQRVFADVTARLLPRTAAQQSRVGEPIDVAALQAGDLVFYNTLKRSFSHVGIYVGNGQFVHSPRSGARVRLERMSDAYWLKRFDGARQLLGG